VRAGVVLSWHTARDPGGCTATHPQNQRIRNSQRVARRRVRAGRFYSSHCQRWV
jgi:hypothetical protein